MIYDCIQKTIKSAKQNNKKPITYSKNGVTLTTIGSNIIFKKRDGVENFKTNMLNLFRMIKQESSEPYGNYFLNNVLFIVHKNHNCIMDYLFSLQHDLGTFYNTLIEHMIPYSNCSGSAQNKKSISFLASNNNVISENVLQKIVKKEMEAVRNNVTLINKLPFKSDKDKMKTWNKKKDSEKTFFNFIDEFTMTNGNDSAIITINSMSLKKTDTPGMNNPIVNPRLLIKKVKETACVVVGFHYLIENNVVTGDLKAELLNFIENKDENYNVNQENVNNEIEKFITNEDIVRSMGLIGNLSQGQRSESLTLHHRVKLRKKNHRQVIMTQKKHRST